MGTRCVLCASVLLAAGAGLSCSGAPASADSSGGVGGSGGASSGGASSGGGGAGGADSTDVLVFSRTAGYRHAAIPAGLAALEQLAQEQGWQLTSTEDPAVFTDAALEPFDVAVFLLTTGDVLAPEQEAAFERFIRSGKGYVGVHSASDTEYDWPFYGELVGAYFAGHGAVQTATVWVEDSGHPATQGLVSPWVRSDEWYGFDQNPRSTVSVLLTIDETSFDPGAGAMGSDHPIAWCHEFDGGRAFYTALGHTEESYAEAAFLSHLEGGIEWAAGGR